MSLLEAGYVWHLALIFVLSPIGGGGGGGRRPPCASLRPVQCMPVGTWLSHGLMGLHVYIGKILNFLKLCMRKLVCLRFSLFFTKGNRTFAVVSIYLNVLNIRSNARDRNVYTV